MTPIVTISELRYRVLPDCRRGRRLVELTHKLQVRVRTPGEFGMVIIVPKGTQSDLASIPRALWPIMPPDGPYQEAAVVHDWMYAAGYSRWWADAIFRYIMEATGIPLWKRWVMWAGVRLSGWAWWSNAK
jgi:hypothetical protein